MYKMTYHCVGVLLLVLSQNHMKTISKCVKYMLSERWLSRSVYVSMLISC